MAEKGAKKTTGKGVKAKTAAKASGVKTDKKASAVKRVTKAGKKKTSFKLRAPEAVQVYVAGCFNDWDAAANPLERDADGTWSCVMVLEPGTHEYRFVVDGAWWDDPLATMRVPNDFGCENCVILVES
jgi:1,4-alpha-glucan branching enzyme